MGLAQEHKAEQITAGTGTVGIHGCDKRWTTTRCCAHVLLLPMHVSIMLAVHLVTKLITVYVNM
jgi:hypothetical protein